MKKEFGEGSKPDVNHTAYMASYLKVKGNKPSYWQTLKVTGEVKRTEPLFKDSYMEYFAVLGQEKFCEELDNLSPLMPLPLLGAVRHKYINKFMSRLIKDAGNPIQQILILGVGMDTRAVRKRDYKVSFFEVDLPNNFKIKLEVYKSHETDPNATYIGMNYLDNDFIQKLTDHSFDFTQTTLIIWEGNSPYLKLEDIERLFTTIMKAFKGQMYLVFDYCKQKALEKDSQTDSQIETLKKVESVGSRVMTGFTDIETEFAKKFGMELLDNKSLHQLIQYYEVGDNPHEQTKGYNLCTMQKSK